MKKIIIISYYFEPCNFVGAERTNAWAKYFIGNNIYPIIITKQWDNNQLDLGPSEKLNYEIEYNDSHEIHRIPTKINLRDRLIKSGKFPTIRKILSLHRRICDNFSLKYSSYMSFYNLAEQIITNENIDTIIISGTPFQSFIIGYELKKKFSYLRWVPDYRDQWNTHPYSNKNSALRFFFNFLEKKNEKRWVSNATKFITVSENWRDRISSFTGKEGFVIKNGFDFNTLEIKPIKIPRLHNRLVISYIGTLYPYQNINLLLEVVKKLIMYEGYKIYINFVGINMFENQEIKIKMRYPEILPNVTFYERMPLEDLQQIYDQSDLLWLTSFENMKGWYPVKLFDYAKQGIPILLYPSDNDVMQNFVETGSVGKAFGDESEISIFLKGILESENTFSIKPNTKVLNGFTREFQTKQLSEQIREICKES